MKKKEASSRSPDQCGSIYDLLSAAIWPQHVHHHVPANTGPRQSKICVIVVRALQSCIPIIFGLLIELVIHLQTPLSTVKCVWWRTPHICYHVFFFRQTAFESKMVAMLTTHWASLQVSNCIRQYACIMCVAKSKQASEHQSCHFQLVSKDDTPFQHSMNFQVNLGWAWHFEGMGGMRFWSQSLKECVWWVRSSNMLSIKTKIWGLWVWLWAIHLCWVEKCALMSIAFNCHMLWSILPSRKRVIGWRVGSKLLQGGLLATGGTIHKLAR